MNIKKALTLIAWGFAFTLININLNFGDFKINVTPDFIGWILMYLSFDYLGDYGKDKRSLKGYSLGLAILTAILWAIDFTALAQKYDMELILRILNTIVDFVAGIYSFILFGILEKICVDYNVPYGDKIRTLKYINLAVFIIISIIQVIVYSIPLEVTAVILMITGVVAIVAAIITLITLFKLKNAIEA